MAVTAFDFNDRRSRLGTLVLDVLLTEEISFEANATQFPVEDGGQPLTDHIVQGPKRLRISGNISTASVESFAMLRGIGGTGPTKIVDAIEALEQMWAARALVDVSTGQLLHRDMAFDGPIVARRSATGDGGNWLEVQAELVRIRRVKLKTAEAPAAPAAAGTAGDGGAKGRAGKTAAKAGKATKATTAAEQFGPPTAGTGGGTTPGAGNGLTPGNNGVKAIGRYASGLFSA